MQLKEGSRHSDDGGGGTKKKGKKMKRPEKMGNWRTVERKEGMRKK